MATSVSASQDGDIFQARVFWLNAANLLDDSSSVVAVGYEIGPKGFDDVWIEHDPARTRMLEGVGKITREHVQCKWHVRNGEYGHKELIDPDFINATSKSFLERALSAQTAHAPDGDGMLFKLATNWRVAAGDPLNTVLATRSGLLRLNQLFDGKNRSIMAGVRKLWGDHLKADEAQLKRMAAVLSFGAYAETLQELRDRLNERFQQVGLRPVPANESTFRYDALPIEWLAQGKQRYDKKALLERLRHEGLLGVSAKKVIVAGIKSFQHPYDVLEDRATTVLDLTGRFDERYIHSPESWSNALYPEMKAFLTGLAKQHTEIRLALDAHSTIAVAAGSILNVKSGRKVELEQRTGSTHLWSVDDVAPQRDWSTLIQSEVAISEGPEIAVALGITHQVSRDVEAFVRKALPSVGKLIVLEPTDGVGPRVVKAGAHANQLAEKAVSLIRAANTSAARVHVFLATPNALAFFLGQQQEAIGRLSLYEFEFDKQGERTYRPSLELPCSGKAP